MKLDPSYGEVPDQPSASMWRQKPALESRFELDIKLFKASNKTGIIDFFARHGLDIQLDMHYNVSIKKYTRKDLSQEDIAFLQDYYREDYELYESAMG